MQYQFLAKRTVTKTNSWERKQRVSINWKNASTNRQTVMTFITGTVLPKVTSVCNSETGRSTGSDTLLAVNNIDDGNTSIAGTTARVTYTCKRVSGSSGALTVNFTEDVTVTGSWSYATILDKLGYNNANYCATDILIEMMT